MDNVEMNTIIDAMTTKKTWLKKSFNEFLTVWSERTKGINDKNIFIGSYTVSEGDTLDIYIKGNDDSLWYTQENYDGYRMEEDYFVESGNKPYDTLTIDIIRFTTERLNDAITDYFKKIQKNIDKDSGYGQELTSLINKFS